MGAIQVSLESMPSHLGRYRITSRIATSISGAVYRAWDDELRRDVAIRVPSREWLTAPSLVDEYLAKASRLSRIEHPQIVPLYDVGRTDDGHCYLVTKFIAEENLADRSRRAPPTASWSVSVIVQLAEALHFAHKSGMIHGNVTPAHVVFDEENVPCLTGFGLPLFPAARLLGSGRAGEAGYQSPEQLSGELHRIDARADVYSLGAVLYELLAGQWPLAQQPVSQVIRQAMQYEPPLLSDLDPTQPVELARVCQKALSRRIGDRYSTIVDFAADLQQCIPMLPDPAPAVAAENWTAFPPGTVSPTANGTTAESGRYGAADNADSLVVPKGLRSFDQEDSDFFLELLPGPRGRSGLPDTLHFWKSQIEETDPAATFSVGLIYGPSGCGKSSLVKAGLLPRLDDWIIPVYIEATPEATEARLLAQLRRRCPLLPGHLELTEALAELRRGKFLPAGKKVVIFLDQFEQWLHASRDDERPELSAALRQCDGRRLQCIVMVRDDFWMAVTRFMHDIEVKLVEGHNSAAVDLFGVPHARKVLTAFGRAYQCLPRTESDQTPQERAFLDQAIAGLAQDGKVVSVQLALFAEMVKNKPWTPETLAEVGGAEGIGLTFLEETFSGTHSPPEHRRHQRAARAVLRLLLPEQGTDIKGQMHSHERLLTGSGYAERPKEFEELLNILDQELRLVTPADPAGLPENQKSENPILSSHFQLTHDFLVPSVRRWLVRNQQETRRGRAELLLDEKTATWIVRPERRYLPSSWQWFRMRTLTSPRAWSLTQRDMMHSASVYHSVRAVGALAIVAFLTWGSFEALLAVRAQNLRARLLYVHLREVPSVIQDMASNRWWVNRFVRAAAASAVPHSPEDMRARLALLPDDSAQVEYLYEECFAVDDDSLTLITSELAPYREQFVQRLWTTIEDPAVNGERQLRASIMLARIAAPQQGELPGRWAESVSTVARHLHEATLADPSRFQSLVTGLAPVSHLLVDLLSERARDETRTKTDRAVAANILIEYAAGRADVLTAVLLDSQNTNRQSIIIEKLQPMAAQAVALLEPELAKRSDDLRTTWKDGPLNLRTDVDAQLTKEIEEADGLVADWFSFCQSLPLEDFQRVADGLRSAGYRPTRFRPFLGNDVVLVAALWTRDDRTGKIETGLTESEMRLQVSGPRMKSELLVDLAAYQTPTGEVKHTAVWAERRDTDPEATAYIGPYGDLWYQTLASQNKEGFGIVGQDFRPLVEIGPALSAVFWKGRSPGEREIRSAPRLETELAGEIAGRVVVSIDVTPVAAHSRADARRAEHFNVIRDNEEKTRTHPENLQPWIWGGHRRFLVGQYEQTIRDLTHVIENWSDSSGEPWMLHTCHEYRTYAAARLGHKQEAAQYLEQANAVIGDSPFWQEFRKQAMTLNGGELHNQAEEFEKFAVPFFGRGWAERGTAQLYAVAAAAFRTANPARAAGYTDRAIELLELAVKNGEARNLWWFLVDPFFDAIADDPRMIPLQIAAEFDNITPIKYARAGNAARARDELIHFLQTSTDAEYKLRAEVLVEVLLGEDEKAMQRVEASLAANPDGISHFGHVSCYALAGHVVSEQHPDRAKVYFDRALELLRMRINRPFGIFTAAFRRELLWWWGFGPLRNLPEFESVLAGLDRAYSVSTLDDPELESRVIYGLAPGEHLEECRKLAAQGFRPVAIDACLAVGASIAGTASVWHRPKVSETQRDEFARRQSSAAVALLRLGKSDSVWSMLKTASDVTSGLDPRLRSWLVQLLGPLGTDPLLLGKRLASEPDVSIRRGLLLALGRSAIDELTSADRDSIIDRILTVYRSDPDPGNHSAAEWALRKFNQREKLITVDAELASAKSAPTRPWSVTAEGHVLVTVPGPVEFQMGTPSSEPERDTSEVRHRRRIPRSFAIATKEVTVQQWDRFIKACPHIKYQANGSTSPEPECPVAMATWYQMAAYCRWLSEQEGLHEDEIGYPTQDQIREGMQLKSHFLSRSGYRLPTEAEWEYACRADTETSWYHGESVELLPQYAWFKDNAQGRTWPVATLSPNDWGLFDMEGNINEMCHSHLTFPGITDGRQSVGNKVLDDAYPTQRLSQHLSCRGGSYAYERNHTRSGRRWDHGKWNYENRTGDIGFRVVRTVIPRELKQAREYRRQANQSQRNGKSSEGARARTQAQVTYEQLLARHPENPDYPWELADFLLESTASSWHNLNPVGVASQAGATLSVQSDSSILASGTSPDRDIYTIRFESQLPAITALRVEFLPDAPLPENVASRNVASGNFHLSELSASIALGVESDQRSNVPIRNASVDYSQSVLDAINLIDGDPETAWGIPHDTGKPHWAIFQFRDRISLDAASKLSVDLEIQNRGIKQSGLGRFQFSVSTSPDPDRIPLWLARLSRSSLSGWTRLAAAYTFLEEHDSALAALAKAGKDPQGEFADDLFLLALMNHELGRSEDARSWLERGLARYDKNTDDVELRKLAGDLFNLALEQQPSDLAFLTRMANLLGISVKGNGPKQALVTRGRMHFDKGERGKAAADFARALSMLPKSFSGDSARAELASVLSEFDESFLKMAELQPYATDILLARGRRHASHSRWKEAANDLGQVVNALPAGPVGEEWFQYGALLILAGRDPEYAQLMRTSVERFENDGDSRTAYFLARATSLSRDPLVSPSQILRWVEHASVDKHKPRVRRVLGMAQFRAGMFETGSQTIELTRSETKDQVEDVLNLLGLALIQTRLGNHQIGRESLDKALAKIPENGMQVDATDWLEMRILLREAEELIFGTEILKISEDLAADPEDRAKLLSRRAELYMRTRHWQKAADDYGLLVQMEDNNKELLQKQLKCLVNQRNWKAAAEPLRRLLQLEPNSDSHLNSMRLSVLLASADDPADYHTWSNELLTRVVETRDPFVAERVGKGSLLLPPQLSNLKAAVHMADQAVTLNPTHEVLPWAWATRALAAYREGEDVAALDWAGRSLKADAAMPFWYRAALAHSVVAMAQHRLKHPEAARQALSLAEGLIQPVTDRYDRAGQVDGEWHDWLIADLLLREAREAIAAAPIPASGKAP